MNKLLSILLLLALFNCLFTTAEAREWEDYSGVTHYQYLNRYPSNYPPGHPLYRRDPYSGRRLSEHSLGMLLVILFLGMGLML